MSDYSKSTNFTSKDTLPTGNAGKIVKGTELDTEFTAISSAIASKADISSPALLGTPTTPTATTGTNTTQIASTAFVKASVDALGTMAAQNKTAVDITGGTIVGITDLAVTDGGTGASSITANSVVLGNGTSALSGNLVAPGTSGNVLTSNGTSWTSAVPAPVVTSAIAGNGIQVSSATGAVTFSVSPPTFNTVGSYVFGGAYWGDNGSTPQGGSNYAAGSGQKQMQAGKVYVENAGNYLLTATSNTLSGTWKWMGQSGDQFTASSQTHYSVLCRVS